MNNIKINSPQWRLPVSALCAALMLAGCGGGSSPKKSGGDKPGEPTFHYKVVDDGTPGFRYAKSIMAEEQNLAGQGYFGFYSNGFSGAIKSDFAAGSYALNMGAASTDACTGGSKSNCYVSDTGQMKREAGLRFRYQLGKPAAPTVQNHIGYDDKLFVGSLPEPFATEPKSALVLGAAYNADRALSATNYRMLLRVCTGNACTASDVTVTLKISGSGDFEVDAVALNGGTEQTVITKGDILKKVAAVSGNMETGSNLYYTLKRKTVDVAKILPLPLATDKTGLTLAAVAPVGDNQSAPFGVGVPVDFQSRTDGALWRGWKTDGAASYARSAIKGETRGVVDDVVYGGATASLKPMILQGGPLLVALRPDNGEMFVGLKELQTEVKFENSVNPELSPADLEKRLAD